MNENISSNEMQEYIDQRAKAKGSKSKSTAKKTTSLERFRSRGLILLSFFKKSMYKLFKVIGFFYFVYMAEYQFSLMRKFVGKHGGLKKQGMM